MNAKHQFKYTFSESDMEEFSPVEITFEVPGDVSIPQMLYNFESYLKACGFYFDGHLEIVDDTLNNIDTVDEIYGCLSDYDKNILDGSEDCCDGKDCGCESTSSPLETSEGNNQFDVTKNTSSSKDSKWTKAEKMLKEWNEGIAKLDNEQLQKAMKTAHEMSGLHYEATKEVKKNNWVHGMCNPPADDAKEYVKDCKSTGKKYNSVDAMLKSLMKKRSKDSQLY